MREYKFRAWDKKINKMFYSDNCFFAFINGNFIERDGENGSDKDSQIVMQCTGVKDANGKEIYDQDIVKWDDGEEIIQMIVEWSQGGFVFLIINDPYNRWKEIDMSIADEVKIIGNAFENPELLEKVNGMDECDSNDM